MEQASSVAVIIAAYNAEKTIERAIRSALTESCVREVLVVDDCSSDNTFETARSCDDKSGRLKVFKQDKNAGPSAARNVALENCQSEWMTILDSDDFYLAGRLDKMLHYSENYDIIADDMYQVSEFDIDGERQTLLQPPQQDIQDISLSGFVLSNVTRSGRTRGELGFIKPLIRMSFIRMHNIHYQEHMRLGEDYEIYTRLLALGARMVLLPVQGYVSVRRENSLSGLHSIEDLKNLRDCNDEILKDFSLSRSDTKAIRAHYLSVDCRYQWRALIEAVKTRNIRACLKCFARPYPVPFYLIGQLLEQVVLRTAQRFK